jgi:hypothetical protein
MPNQGPWRKCIGENYGLGWNLASICWGCIMIYLAFHRAWSAAAIAAGAASLGALASAINLLWLWQ